MTLEFKFNAAFPYVELHERGQWRRALGYAGKWARSGCGPEKIPADDGDDDGRLNEEEECCCCVARDGPQGEVWCVREWVKEDSGPSSSVLQIASCQVTERDLRLSGPSLAYPDDAIVLCLPLRKKKKNKKKKAQGGSISARLLAPFAR